MGDEGVSEGDKLLPHPLLLSSFCPPLVLLVPKTEEDKAQGEGMCEGDKFLPHTLLLSSYSPPVVLALSSCALQRGGSSG